MFLFDNMDMVLQNLMQSFTLPVLVFRGKKEDLDELPSNDAKTLDEKVEIHEKGSTFLLASEENQPYLEAYTTVMHTVLTDLVTSNFSKFTWMKKFFPTHQEHLYCEASKKRSIAHVEKPLFVSENKTLNMVQIMTHLQDRWLELLHGVVADPDYFTEMLRVLRDAESTNEEMDAGGSGNFGLRYDSRLLLPP